MYLRLTVSVMSLKWLHYTKMNYSLSCNHDSGADVMRDHQNGAKYVQYFTPGPSTLAPKSEL